MKAIVTPEEMAAIDAAAPEPVAVLIERAGAAVAWAARRLLGGTYGRRVVVLAGKGNNGNDGRVAARRLAAWGARVTVLDAPTAPAELGPAELVIDAAYGTGLRGSYTAPAAAGTPVLAVDIASGVDGLTGEVRGVPLRATQTVTFAALKPGLLLPPGGAHHGDIRVADIGLDVSGAHVHLVERADVGVRIPRRAVDAHKWRQAVWVIGASPGMAGAACLAAGAAARAGAGYVRLSSPGQTIVGAPIEAVQRPLAGTGWDISDAGRFGALVLGPGLGRDPQVLNEVTATLELSDRPAVVDGDALHAPLPRRRGAPTVLTPHDAEFAVLTGHRPQPDRLADTRAAAHRLGAVVLLKGPATVIAAPDGRVLVTTTGDSRLATAGTGDVLAGTIGALLAAGIEPLWAAAMGSWLHGRAAQRGLPSGLVAGDLPELLAREMAELAETEATRAPDVG
jgi:NAD(P)H-hydrate epimerase